MSNKYSEYSEISGRLLQLADYLKEKKGINNSQLLKEAGIGHSFFSNIRNKKIENPNSEMIRKIVKVSGANGHWVLSGDGPMFKYEYGSFDEMLMASEPGQGPGGAFIQALEAIQRIEQQPDAIKDIPLPQDLELKLAQLLVRLLERRSGSTGT